MNLTPGQLARIGALSDQWSFLWDKRRSLWIAAEDCPDGVQVEEGDLDVLLHRLPLNGPTSFASQQAAAVERRQLLRIEEGGRLAHVPQPEQRLQLVVRPDLDAVARTPAQQHQVVDERTGQVAVGE